MEIISFVCTTEQILLIGSTSFDCTNNRSSAFKTKFGKASSHCQRLFEPPKAVYAHKVRDFISSQKLSSQNLWPCSQKIVNLLFLLLFNDLEILPVAFDKGKSCAETIFENPSSSLPVFPSKTKLKLRSIA